MTPKSLLPLLLPVLAGCNGDVTLAVTDAPVDFATSVTVQFDGVEFERTDGGVQRFTFSPPRRVNLLALEGGEREVLVSDGIRVDDYQAIRLRVSADGNAADSFIELDDGSRHGLLLAEADEGKLRLTRRFSVASGDRASFTVDFDLRKSVLAPAGTSDAYRLVPALRVVADSEIGTLAGVVSQDLLILGCVPAVYVFTGSSATPDDVGSSREPLNTGRVLLDEESGEFRYRIGVLPAGPYTAAFTCEADFDVPDLNDDVFFEEQKNVTVEAGKTATADF